MFTKRFKRRKQKGSISIEFALIAPLFFALIFSAFEAGLMYMKVALVEMNVSKVTRVIYTGQASEQGITSDKIIESFCDEVGILMKCDENVTLEVITLSTYKSKVPEKAKCHEGDLPPNIARAAVPQRSSTAGGDIVFVRFCITTNLMVPALKKLTFDGVNVALRIPETEDGKYAITASTVIRNEPVKRGVDYD